MNYKLLLCQPKLTRFGQDAAGYILAFHGPHSAREPCVVTLFSAFCIVFSIRA